MKPYYEDREIEQRTVPYAHGKMMIWFAGTREMKVVDKADIVWR